MPIKIDIIKTEKLWDNEKWLKKNNLKAIIHEVIKLFPNFTITKNVEIAIVLTNNQQMQQLNNEFLGKNKPTNVLSFPEVKYDYKRLLEFKPPCDYIKLGDIAFGYQITLYEANDQGKKFEHHFTHLLIHGVLHLLGFDHEVEEDAKIMQGLEIEVLKLFSIDQPY